MDINFKQIKYNISPRTKAIEYIVVHDTGNTGKGANAESHFNYFNTGNRQSSADFFVDDTEVLQVNDYEKNYSWHCGDGGGKNGIGNGNSIGIELCINSDGNYEVAYAKLVQLVVYLMGKLGVDSNHVVRHYDASGKRCPGTFAENDWAKWFEFKTEIDDIKEEEEEMIYNYIDGNMPEWARETIQKLVDKGYLKGNESGELGLNDTMLKIFVVNDRAGIYG